MCPWGVPSTAAHKNKHPKVGVPKPTSKKKAKKWVGYSLGGGRLFFGEVRLPDSEWGEDLRGPSVCPQGVPDTATPKNDCPKVSVPTPQRIKGQKMGGQLPWWGHLFLGTVCPPDSERGEALRGPSVGLQGVPGTASPKNKHPKGRVPKPPGEKKAKKRVGYSIGGGRRRSSSAELGMG